MELNRLKYSKENGSRIENDVTKVETKRSSTNKKTILPNVVLSSDYTKPEGEIDTRILFILSGGTNRERNYFKMLKDDHRLKRIKVAFASKKGQGLNPTQLLEVANKSVDSEIFVTEEASYRFEKKNGDIIYLLQDIDQFEPEIRRLTKKEQPDCLRWIYSNPAFEMWLYYHYFDNPLPQLKDAIEKTLAERSQWLKSYLPRIIDGGVKTTKAIAQIRIAIGNSKANYREENNLPVLFSTKMHMLAEDMLDTMGDEYDEMLERRAAYIKAMMEKFKKPIVKSIRYDGKKIQSLIGALSKWADSNSLSLPLIQKDGENVTSYFDNRDFHLSYKIKKEYLDDNSGKSMPINMDELYMVNIQNEIYHFYNILFIQNTPIVSYTIDFSEIKDIIDLLGLDSHYAILSSFHLRTFDTIYGGVPLKETDWGYIYKNVPIYEIHAHGRFLIIMREEYLPKADYTQYVGENTEFELIDDKNYIYSNIHQMKDLNDYYGLTVMRVVKFQLPQKGSFRFIKLNVLDYAKDKSEYEKLSKTDIVYLMYQEGDFVKYKGMIYKIQSINKDGEIRLSGIKDTVSLNDITPVKIDGVQDANIYYDPIVAAHMVALDEPIPSVIVNQGYYMESFKNDIFEDGISLFDKVVKCRFAYVHELQHWLLETQGQSGLKIR